MSSYYSPGNPNAWNTIETDPLGNWAVLRKPAAQWGIPAASALGVVLAILVIFPLAGWPRAWSDIRKVRVQFERDGITCFLCDTFLVTEFNFAFSGKDFATGLLAGLNLDERGQMVGTAIGKIIGSLMVAAFIVGLGKTSLARQVPPFQPKSRYDQR